MLLTVASTGLRELARRRVALLLVLLLPCVFYWARIDVSWQAIRFLAIGATTAWAAYFTVAEALTNVAKHSGAGWAEVHVTMSGMGLVVEVSDDGTGGAHEGKGIDPAVVRSLMGRRRDPLAALTPREREALTLMAEGRSNTSIAEALVVTGGAVEKHTQRTFAELGLSPDDDARHRRVATVVRLLRSSRRAPAWWEGWSKLSTWRRYHADMMSITCSPEGRGTCF